MIFKDLSGISQEFIQGDPNSPLDKVICMSAFHLFINGKYVKHTLYYKYIQYLLLSITTLYETNPDWNIRLYIDNSIFASHNAESDQWKSIMNILKKIPTLQIVSVKWQKYYSNRYQCHQGLAAALFRYLALFDEHVDVCIFRDIDNIWTEQDFYFTERWIESGEDGFMYIDPMYKKREIVKLTEHDVIRGGEEYLSIFAGIWGYRLRFTPLDIWRWHQMIHYITTSNSFVYNIEYKGFKFYRNPFIYGFEELALSRVFIPNLLMDGKSFKSVNIKVWQPDSFDKLFDDRLTILHDMIGLNANTKSYVRTIVMEKYWDMESSTSGLAQYLLCILSNIYFRIITEQSSRFENMRIEPLLKEIYPIPFLMGLGMFVFKNIIKYDWRVGKKLVDRAVSDDYFEIDWMSL